MATATAVTKDLPKVLIHYNVPSTLPDGDFKVKCKYCVKEISGSLKSTSNWWKHLVSYTYVIYHIIILFFTQRRSHAEELKQCSSEQQSMSLFVQPLKKYDANHPKQKRGTEALVDFIAEDLMPLHLVESQWFQKLLSLLDPQYTLPSRKHLSKTLLRNKYDRPKAVVIEHLTTVTTLSLTIDLWSNRQMRSYLGITAHYITGNWKLEHIVLGCNRVQGRHTAENIQFWYDEVVSDFGISEKVKHIITDSGSNIKKTFTQVTLPGYEEEDTDDLSDEDEDKDNFESISTSSLDGFSFERHACFAHTLQLVIKDGLARAGQLNSVIKRCSKLVSFVRKSTVATDILEGEKRLQCDNATRWNSQLQMICSVLSVPEHKLSFIR